MDVPPRGPQPGDSPTIFVPDEAGLAELRLLCEVARLDGTVTAAERRFLFAHALVRGVPPDDARRVLAEVEARVGKARVALPEGDRTAVVRALLGAACADGDVTPKERAFVERIARGLAVPASVVEAELAQALARTAKENRPLGDDPGPPPRQVPPGAFDSYLRSTLGHAWVVAAVAFFAVLPAVAAADLRAGVLTCVALATLAVAVSVAVWQQRAHLLRRGVAVQATARVVRRIHRKARNGPLRVIGVEVFYTYRLGDQRGQARVVLRPNAPIERGDRLWVFVNPRAPAQTLVAPRWW